MSIVEAKKSLRILSPIRLGQFNIESSTKARQFTDLLLGMHFNPLSATSIVKRFLHLDPNLNGFNRLSFSQETLRLLWIDVIGEQAQRVNLPDFIGINDRTIDSLRSISDLSDYIRCYLAVVYNSVRPVENDIRVAPHEKGAFTKKAAITYAIFRKGLGLVRYSGAYIINGRKVPVENALLPLNLLLLQREDENLAAQLRGIRSVSLKLESILTVPTIAEELIDLLSIVKKQAAPKTALPPESHARLVVVLLEPSPKIGEKDSKQVLLTAFANVADTSNQETLEQIREIFKRLGQKEQAAALILMQQAPSAGKKLFSRLEISDMCKMDPSVFLLQLKNRLRKI